MLVIWLLVAGVVVFGLWWLYRRGQQVVLRERERQAERARLRAQRERARRVLTGDLEPLRDPPLELAAGETAYYQTAATHLEAEADGSFRRLARGQLVVTNRGTYFCVGGAVQRRHRMQEIERIDIPFADVIALVSFRDTLTHDEEQTFYQVEEPLVLAAHISRHTAFELILS